MSGGVIQKKGMRERLKEINKSKATGSDGIHSSLSKTLVVTLLNNFTQHLNVSLEEERLPAD